VHSDVTRAADPQVARTLTSLFTSAAEQQPGRDVARRLVVARLNCSRITVNRVVISVQSALYSERPDIWL